MADAVPNSAFGFGTPFAEQLEFFRQKLNLPSERWDDIIRQAHDKAFIVAGAARADLLQDLRTAVDSAIANGTGIQQFRKEFNAIVQKHGWVKFTGSGSKAGIAWRTKVIYQTNMTTSYAAGRWQQLHDPDLVKLRPYLQYVHNDGVLYPRPLHLSWHGFTAAREHPFWQTHFAPNGWGCQCRIIAVAKPNDKQLPDGWDTINPATGAPNGIDQGFDYAFGASVTQPLQSFIDNKLIKLDAPIGAAMWEVLKPAIAVERQLMWWDKLEALSRLRHPDGGHTVLSAMSRDVLEWLGDNNKPLPLSAEIAVPHYLPFGKKQARHIAQANALSLEDWRNLPALLDRPGAIYYDNHNNTLIYVAEQIGPTKVIVEFDPKKTGKKKVNFIKTAFRLDEVSIAVEVENEGWEIVKVFGSR